MTEDHFTENVAERNRRLERERDRAFDNILEPAKRLIEARAVVAAEGGMHPIGSLSNELMAEIDLIRAMSNFKLPEYIYSEDEL